MLDAPQYHSRCSQGGGVFIHSGGEANLTNTNIHENTAEFQVAKHNVHSELTSLALLQLSQERSSAVEFALHAI